MKKNTKKLYAVTLAAVMAAACMPYFPQEVVDVSYSAKSS